MKKIVTLLVLVMVVVSGLLLVQKLETSLENKEDLMPESVSSSNMKEASFFDVSSEVEGTIPNNPADTPVLFSEIPPGEFRSQLGKLPKGEQHWVLEKLAKNRQLLSDIDSLRVDSGGMFYYVCSFGPDGHERVGVSEKIEGNLLESGGAEESGVLVPISSPPALHSRPGSSKILFLDFNGHVIEGTRWNTTRGVSSWNCLPYDSDGDTGTFSTSELSTITQVWERVSEDFSPFDVDVTTEEPVTWTWTTAHALITPGLDASGVSCPHNGSGGIAYLDVFGDFDYSYNYSGDCYSPVWCRDYDAADAAEVISHELGHNLALSHDGLEDATGTTIDAYYDGHENGSISWGTIMGSSYNDDISQWSKGEYFRANNTADDDLAKISSNLGYRPDDHGDSIGSADAMNTNASGYWVESGVVETTGDLDTFSFEVSSTGQVDISASPYRAASDTWGGNLDISLELYDGVSALIATNNPVLEAGASILTNLPSGIYYLQVKPTGVGNPLVDPPTGYALYASLGQYKISIVPPGGIKAVSNTEGFEHGEFGLWKQSEVDDMDWMSRQESTPSSSTGPSGASVGNYYLYTEASNHNNETAILESGRFNLAASVLPVLIFDYHMYGSDMGSLSVDVYDGTWHSNVWSRTGQQHTSESDSWETAAVDLSNYADQQDVVLRFRGTTGAGYKSDMAIDNLRISVDFDDDGLPDFWELQYFGGFTGAVAAVDVDNDRFNNLDEYISGTVPTDSNSYFKVLGHEISPSTNFVLQWDAVAGRTYRVDWNSDLIYQSFSNISGNLPYPLNSYTDTVERADQQNFYHVEVWLEE